MLSGALPASACVGVCGGKTLQKALTAEGASERDNEGLPTFLILLENGILTTPAESDNELIKPQSLLRNYLKERARQKTVRLSWVYLS